MLDHLRRARQILDVPLDCRTAPVLDALLEHLYEALREVSEEVATLRQEADSRAKEGE